MLSNYLPSKRIVAFFIIPISAVAILFLWNWYSKNDNQNTNEMLDTANKLQESNDSDGDGIQDWEEDLIKTDKNKKDTDGDGLSDKLEIFTGTDPLDPLNEEKTDKQILTELKGEMYNYKFDPELTITDKVALEFLEEGMNLSENGMSFNEDAQKQVISKIINGNLININLSKYTKDDLNISNSLTPENFLVNLFSSTKDLDNSKMTEETVFLYDYLLTHNKDMLSQIDENANIYQLYLDQIIKLKIPPTMVDKFVNYINAINAEIEILNIYSQTDVDVVATVQAMSIATEIDTILANSYFKLLER